MTLTEMSNEFDILYNNIMSNQAPGLDEYEKSVFLTKAQNELILEYFSPKGNKFQEGFDGSERRQIDFSNLIYTVEGETASGLTTQIDERSTVFKLQQDNKPKVLLVLNEFLRLNKSTTVEPVTNVESETDVEPATSGAEIKKILTVVPVSYIEYTRLMLKPYKLPVKSQAWRLFNSEENSSITTVYSEILYNSSAYENFTAKYIVRYIKRPSPIILIDLSDAYSDVTIDGENNTGPMECELDPIMHHDIVQRAVELAKAAYTGDLNTQIQVGSVSATNLGVIPSQDKGDRR